MDNSVALSECQNTTRHDASAALTTKGRVYAVAAERIDRVKHSCEADVAHKHLVKRLNLETLQLDCRYIPYREPHHHLAHAASAFYASPFKHSAVLVLDGMGPYKDGRNVSTSLWLGKETELHHIESVDAQGICYRSVGHFYAAASYYLGFPFYDVSYTMSLAPFGDPSIYREKVESLIWDTDDGLFETDRDFIRYATWMRFGEDFDWQEDEAWIAINQAKYASMFGPLRRPGDTIEERHKNIAASVQERLEYILAAIVRRIRATLKGVDTFCYAGGVALNCVANQRVLVNAGFREIYIQPAASDDGISLGRLLFRAYNEHGAARTTTVTTPYLGPPYTRRDLETALAAAPAGLSVVHRRRRELLDEVAARIAAGQVVAWVQGRSEFGPRALGHRSVLADPRNPLISQVVSQKFKTREWFRPFAPSVIESRLPEYFVVHSALRFPMRFMLVAVPALPPARHAFAGALHVDGTARVQAVPEDNSIYAQLLAEFGRQTGVPGLINTSFNPPGAPIVETPTDAIDAFLGSNLDALVLGPWVIERKAQP